MRRLRAIHQLLPNLTAEDAIGEYALLLQKICQKWGLESRLYVERTNVPGAGTISLHRFPGRFSSEEAVIYHHSVGSHAATRFETCTGGTRILSYHNITPPQLLSSAPFMAARANLGLTQLEALSGIADIGVADSEFNRQDLLRAGFTRTAVVHLALSNDRCRGLAAAAQQRAAERQTGSPRPPRFLHVGRVLPHKALDEVLHTFAVYQKVYGRGEATLHIVGDMTEVPDYGQYLEDLVEENRVPGVHFTGRVSLESLFLEFREADLYLCASRHEGFCVPLVECMVADVPVLAVSAGAIGEIAGQAAIITRERDPHILAETAHQILKDSTLRSRILAAQHRRAAAYSEAALEERLQTLFRGLGPDSGAVS